MSTKNQQGEGTAIIPSERIESKIYFIRGKKVLLDRDLAALYGVQTKVFNQAVKRNKKRFPDDDFIFQLTEKETENFKSLILQNEISESEKAGLMSQNVTLKTGHGKHTKYLPTVFTEQGVAMLSSVLNSERAIQVNIQIIKTFTRLRQLMVSGIYLAGGQKTTLFSTPQSLKAYCRRSGVSDRVSDILALWELP